MKHATAFLVAAALATATLAPSAAGVPTDDKTIAHVLNRIAFGPRPGDIEKVREMGVETYIERQLHPETIPDALADEKVAHLKTVSMSTREIAETYEAPALEARRERRQQQAANPDMPAPEPGQRGRGAQPGQPGQPGPMGRGAAQAGQVPLLELSEHKMTRAIYSERQLQEVLTDFWFNHFNVDASKNRDRYLITEYEREAIRPHVLGKFRDLLGATAKSPAMLFYLDNFQSSTPVTAQMQQPIMPRNRGQFQGQGQGQGRGRGLGQGQGRGLGQGRGFGPGQGQLPPDQQMPRLPQVQNRPRGLNENYARELMELHTLGVDGGYTQQDVTEVARVFTGWTLDVPRQGTSFQFDPRMHDTGDKVVLGQTIRGSDIREGEQVLDMLARHPATAHHIATKLVRRFVADEPPAALVERAAARFLETDGDLLEVTRLVLTSPEFLSPDAYRAKVKTPFEFVASSVRATGAVLGETRSLVRAVQDLGMPLYRCQPPTGYKDTADAWTNTGALVNRMNFALSLAERPQIARATVSADAVLAGDISDTTRATIARATTSQQALALTLGSPEFQRR